MLKRQSSRQSLPPNTAPADEGFLARMMRPTTSSASKTAEKPPLTPPKKAQSVKRPVTRDGAAKGTSVIGSPAEKSKIVHSKTVAKPMLKMGSVAPAAVEKKEEPKAEEPIAVEKHHSEAQASAGDVGEEVKTPAEVYKQQVEDTKAAEASVIDAKKSKLPEESVLDVVMARQDTEGKSSDKAVLPASTPIIASVPAPEPAKEEEKETLDPVLEEKMEPSDLISEKEMEVPTPNETKTEVETQENLNKEEPVSILEPTKEDSKTELSTLPNATQAESVEDPEDVKVREEIARLNAEVMRVAAAEGENDVE